MIIKQKTRSRGFGCFSLRLRDSVVKPLTFDRSSDIYYRRTTRRDSMRAVLCRELGGPEKLVVEDIPSPPMRDGAVRVAIHAAGLNFADILLIAGQYQTKPPLPYTPGSEAAGVVTEVGAGDRHVKPGDHVMAILEGVGYAEEAVTDAPPALPIHANMACADHPPLPLRPGT